MNEEYVAYADVDAYRQWTFTGEGEDLPLDLEKGLAAASRLFDHLPTVQAKFVLSRVSGTDEDSLRSALRDAVCAQVEYWVEIAGGEEVDFSQDILRPVYGGWTGVGEVTLPPYQIVSGRAVQVLMTAGWWSANPNRVGDRAGGYWG